MIARKGKMIRIQGLTKNQMNEVERITSKLTKWEAYTRVEEQTIRSIVIDTLLEYKDIDSQDKLSRRNMQIKELKKRKIKTDTLENLLHQWQATETMSFDCNAGRRDLALYLTEILNR